MNDTDMKSKGTEHGSDKSSDKNAVTSLNTSKRRYFIGLVVFFALFTTIVSSNTLTLFYPVLLREKLFPGTTATKQLVCSANKTSPDYAKTKLIQGKVAEMLMYVGVTNGVPAVVANILLGSFSDQFGRKAQLMIPAVAMLIKESLNVVFMYYKLDIYYLLIPTVIEGCAGTAMCTVTVSLSYVADMTKNNKDRSIGIAVIEIAIGFGAVLGGFVSGYFIKSAGFIWPIGFLCGLALLNILIIIFLVPETVAKKQDRQIRFKTIWLYLKNASHFYIYKNPEGTRWIYNVSLAVLFFSGMTQIARNSVETLYEISPPFCFDSVKVGLFFLDRHFIQQVAAMGLIRLLLICMNDAGIAILGCVSAIAGFIVQGLATTDVILFISPLIGFGGSIVVPMTRVIMSKITPPDQQGAMFGGTSAVQMTCTVLGVVVFNDLLKETFSIHKGLAFFAMAGMNFLALVFLIFLALIPRKSIKDIYELDKCEKDNSMLNISKETSFRKY